MLFRGWQILQVLILSRLVPLCKLMSENSVNKSEEVTLALLWKGCVESSKVMWSVEETPAWCPHTSYTLWSSEIMYSACPRPQTANSCWCILDTGGVLRCYIIMCQIFMLITSVACTNSHLWHQCCCVKDGIYCTHTCLLHHIIWVSVIFVPQFKLIKPLQDFPVHVIP